MAITVAAGRAAKTACTSSGTVEGAARARAKIWNSEVWRLLVNWRLHCRQ